MHLCLKLLMCTSFRSKFDLQNFGEESTSLKPAISSPIQPALPEGWNSSQEVYTLQYRHNPTNRCCLVKGIPLGGQLLISAVVSHTL